MKNQPIGSCDTLFSQYTRQLMVRLDEKIMQNSDPETRTHGFHLTHGGCALKLGRPGFRKFGLVVQVWAEYQIVNISNQPMMPEIVNSLW